MSPTGFEPVHPAPEAGALSGLSYGDPKETDYNERPRRDRVASRLFFATVPYGKRYEASSPGGGQALG